MDLSKLNCYTKRCPIEKSQRRTCQFLLKFGFTPFSEELENFHPVDGDLWALVTNENQFIMQIRKDEKWKFIIVHDLPRPSTLCQLLGLCKQEDEDIDFQKVLAPHYPYVVVTGVEVSQNTNIK